MALHDDLQAVFDRYAAGYRACDAEACAAIYSEDAKLFSPFGPPARGRAAIAALHRDWFEEPETDKRLTVTDCGPDGDAGAFGWALVAYAADLSRPDGTTVVERGHALSIVTRMPGGGWQVTRSSLTPDIP